MRGNGIKDIIDIQCAFPGIYWIDVYPDYYIVRLYVTEGPGKTQVELPCERWFMTRFE